MIPRPPRSTLVPYTTLFRSKHRIIARLNPAIAARRFAEAVGAGILDDAVVARIAAVEALADAKARSLDRKSTRLNSSHANISYAVFCLKKQTAVTRRHPPLH